jgi:uncharacterized membrane protein
MRTSRAVQPQHQDFRRHMQDLSQTLKATGAAAMAAGLWLTQCAAAAADFTVCNQTLDIANVAIADSAAGSLESRGWWVIAPNRCADLVKGKLKSRYVYVHAVDGRGLAMLDGGARLCTSPRQFKASGGLDCWERGYTIGMFKEVDTKDAQSWTLFLREGVKN